MSISGLAITLSPRADEAGAALAALSARSGVELGVRAGRRLAATAETRSPREDRELWEWITALPGVEQVDVVYVGFASGPGVPGGG